jgi:excisionase family DNA binding protein
MENITMDEQLYTLKQVTERIALSRSYLYQMLSEDKFPKPKKFGSANRWFKSDLDQWLADQKLH